MIEEVNTYFTAYKMNKISLGVIFRDWIVNVKFISSLKSKSYKQGWPYELIIFIYNEIRKRFDTLIHILTAYYETELQTHLDSQSMS